MPKAIHSIEPAEEWINLAKVDDASCRPGKKATSTSAGADTKLHISCLFNSPERGFPTSESILFGDVTPPDVVGAALAPMGGLIALYPAPIVLAVTAVPEISQISITNPSGSLHHVISTNVAKGYKGGALVTVGWAEPEMLLCISSKGNCSVFSPHGRKMQSFAVTTTGSEVTHARVFHSGMVTVSYASHASPPEVTLSTWDSSSPINHMEVVHKALPMPKAGHQQLFETMALQGVPLVHSDAGPQLGNLQVVLAPKNGGLLFVSNTSYFHKPYPWTAKLLAVGGVTAQPLAVVTKPDEHRDSWLHIMHGGTHEHLSIEDSVTASVKLDDLMAAFSPEDEPSNYRPSSAISLAWLSDTAVAVVLKQEHAGGVSRKLVIFSCTGYATTLPIDDEPCHVSAEIDGVVVLGHQTWSLVRDVPVAVQRASKLIPDTPAGLLVTASECFQARDPQCEAHLETIRSMPTDGSASAGGSSPKQKAATGSGALPSAVADVVFAAGWMPKLTAKKELLRAAIYGRTHAPQDIDTALIPLCVMHSRVMNSLRKGSGAGRGTTRMQLEWLIIHNRLQYIADVLCSCESFELAYDLASDADLPITGPPVLLRWAQAVIDVLGTDSAACLAWLRKRLDSAAGVDWATVAGYALEKHYHSLGEELLALDRRDRHVVPQLMRQPFNALALDKALGTCDEDLVLLVLLDSFEHTGDSESSRHFYKFMEDEGKEGRRDKDGRLRGRLPDQTSDTFLSFVLPIFTSFLNVGLVRRIAFPRWSLKLLGNEGLKAPLINARGFRILLPLCEDSIKQMNAGETGCFTSSITCLHFTETLHTPVLITYPKHVCNRWRDMWLYELQGMLPDARSTTASAPEGTSLKGKLFDQYRAYAPPVHRALLTLSEVLVSTAGPPVEGEPPGAQKGRASPLIEWDRQQDLLDQEAKTLEHPMSVRKGSPHGPRRGISGLVGGKNPGWWQVDALRRFHALRTRQQKLESQAQLQLVGLSVMDTARKLKMHCRNDVLYEGFVKDFMPEHGRSNLSSRCSRQRFAIECDVLAAKQQFEQLLARGEGQQTIGDDKISLLVTAALKHGIANAEGFLHPTSNRHAGQGFRERLGNIMNGISPSNTQLREQLRDKIQSVSQPARSGSRTPTTPGTPALTSVLGESLQLGLQRTVNVGQRATQVVRDQFQR